MYAHSARFVAGLGNQILHLMFLEHRPLLCIAFALDHALISFLVLIASLIWLDPTIPAVGMDTSS